MPDLWKSLLNGPLGKEQMVEAARELVEQSGSLKVWLFHGEMGSGKTTLIREVVQTLGVKGVVTSPTFSIVNVYGGSEQATVFHFDFYRLKNEMEALDIGFEEYLTSGNVCLIEWPEKVSGLLPNKVFEVDIKFRSEETREIFYRRHE